MNKKTKKYIIIGSIIVVVLVCLFWYVYRRGKRQTTLQDPGKLPGDNTGTVNTGSSNDDLKLLVQAIHDDMDGLNWAGHDITAYQRALQLSDTDLIKLYNAFNSLYQQDSGQTLVEWITNEKYFNHEVTDALLAKMAKLNLK
jgi:hypothetical protein